MAPGVSPGDWGDPAKGGPAEHYGTTGGAPPMEPGTPPMPLLTHIKIGYNVGAQTAKVRVEGLRGE